MVKIQDPTLEFSTVVSSRRRSRAAAAGDRFRLGLHGLGCAPTTRLADHSALIGASAFALKAEQIEQTVEVIGLVGGLLADLGYQVCPIGADSGTLRPSLVVWVCGDETQAYEYEQLAAMEIPGLSIGSCVDGLDDWSFVTAEELNDRRQFVHLFEAEVEALVGSPGSNSWSNGPRQMGLGDGGRRWEHAEEREHQLIASEAENPAGPRVRLLTHIAYFDGSSEPMCFLKIFNDSVNEAVRIDEVWFEADPVAQVNNPQRPLPTLLDAGDLFETWKRLDELPAGSDILTLARARLGNGAVIHAGHNVDVPPAGQVGGGGRPLDEVHVERSRVNSLDPDTRDVFISYATEDRSDVVGPLADVLKDLGVTVWLDALELGIGSSLRESIDRGIAKSAFAVVVLSPSYFAKAWTKYEFNGIVNMTLDGKQGLLPIWHGITREEVSRFSPPLVDRVARSTSENSILGIADEIAKLVRPDLFLKSA